MVTHFPGIKQLVDNVLNITYHQPFTYNWFLTKNSTELTIPRLIGTTRFLHYNLKSKEDLGNIVCYSENKVGKQMAPCRYLIIQTGEK